MAPHYLAEVFPAPSCEVEVLGNNYGYGFARFFLEDSDNG